MSSYLVPMASEDSMHAPLSQSEPMQLYSDFLKKDQQQLRPKVIHDRIHDQMTFHPALVRIIDTLQFQRLRDLHQLGNCRFLFPGASHTRFEHSLGVAHLAMTMLRKIRSSHEDVGPALDVSQADILCVGIAGLCHDLGHGPLSHMFEHFVNRVRTQSGTRKAKGEWHHEDASCAMLDYLIENNKIDMEVEFGLAPSDITFVKRLIQGLRPKAPWPQDIGRGPEKRFLFDIVANKRNGIDVDKLDYFMRDSMSCYGKLPDLHVDRIFTCARVITTDGESQICFEEKVALSLGEIFNLRVRLHKFVYQHRVVKVLDEMTEDALVAADAHLRFTVGDKSYALHETVENMAAYTQTGDWILAAILSSQNRPELDAARRIVERMRTRNLYRLVGCSLICDNHRCNEITPKNLLSYVPQGVAPVPESAVFITFSSIEIGSSGDVNGRDPISRVRFFNPKSDPNKANKLSTDRMSPLFAPKAYEEKVVFFFCRDDEHIKPLHDAFQLWFRHAKRSELVGNPTPFVNATPLVKVATKRDRDDGNSNGPRTPPPPLKLDM